MKIIDFFKSSILARIGGFIFFCSIMVLISTLSLGSLPSPNPTFTSALTLGKAISGISAAVGAGILVFAALKKKFSIAGSLFILLFSYESVGFLTGLIIYVISLNPQNTLFPMSNVMSFYYFFLGILISTISLLCAIATSVAFALYHIARKIIKKARST